VRDHIRKGKEKKRERGRVSERKKGPTYLCSSTRLVTSRLSRAEAASRDNCLQAQTTFQESHRNKRGRKKERRIYLHTYLCSSTRLVTSRLRRAEAV
jgi:hypothetical protein